MIDGSEERRHINFRILPNQKSIGRIESPIESTTLAAANETFLLPVFPDTVLSRIDPRHRLITFFDFVFILVLRCLIIFPHYIILVSQLSLHIYASTNSQIGRI